MSTDIMNDTLLCRNAASVVQITQNGIENGIHTRVSAGPQLSMATVVVVIYQVRVHIAREIFIMHDCYVLWLICMIATHA